MPTELCQASGSNADVIFAEEDSFSTFQLTPGKWHGMRITPGETLAATINTFESNELNATRAVVNLAGGNIAAGGSIPFELGPEGFGTLLKHVLQGTPATQGSVGNFTHVIKASNVTPTGGLSIEKRFNDIGKYLRYWGGRINNFSLTFPQEGYVTGSMDFLCSGEISDENAQAADIGGIYGPSGESIAPTAAFTTDEPFVTFLGSLQEGNPLSDVSFIKSASLQISNQFDATGFVFGNRYRQCIPAGKRKVTGQFVVFFRDMTYYNKFLNETQSGFRMILTRGAKSLEIYIPNLRYTGESPKISATTGLTLTLPFQAIYDTTEETDVRFTLKNTESSI